MSTPDNVRSTGELKQLILRIYNATNQAVWGTGVREQRVDLLGDRVLVVAVHQRVPALAALDGTRRDLTRQVDVALIDHYKGVLSAELQRVLGVGVRAVLKDYDPDTQLSCTLVVFEQPITVPEP
jgi:hypothetical protein